MRKFILFLISLLVVGILGSFIFTDSVLAESCTVTQLGTYRCNSSQREKCGYTESGAFVWQFYSTCQYGCTGTTCDSPENCTGGNHGTTYCSGGDVVSCDNGTETLEDACSYGCTDAQCDPPAPCGTHDSGTSYCKESPLRVVKCNDGEETTTKMCTVFCSNATCDPCGEYRVNNSTWCEDGGTATQMNCSTNWVLSSTSCSLPDLPCTGNVTGQVSQIVSGGTCNVCVANQTLKCDSGGNLDKCASDAKSWKDEQSCGYGCSIEGGTAHCVQSSYCEWTGTCNSLLCQGVDALGIPRSGASPGDLVKCWQDSTKDTYYGSFCYAPSTSCPPTPGCHPVEDVCCDSATNTCADCNNPEYNFPGKDSSKTYDSYIDNCGGLSCIEGSVCGSPPPPGGGGGCTASDPGVPGLVSPTDNFKLSELTTTLSWSAPSTWGTGCPSNTNTYNLCVDTSQTDVENSTAGATGCDYNYTGLSSVTKDFTGVGSTQYFWKIVANNGSNKKASVIWSFWTPAVVSGTVYDDANNTCSTTTKWTLGGLTLSLRETTYTGSVDMAGDYSVSAPVGTYNYLDLLGAPAEYQCSTGLTGLGCGGGCPVASSVNSPSPLGGYNFFLTTKRAAWWQVEGAGVYAGSTGGGTTIQSTLPSASTRLILPGSNELAAILRASGSAPSVGVGKVSETGYSAITKYKGKETNYRFFANKMGVSLSQTNDFGSNKPTNDPAKDFWYQKPTSGEVQLDSSWSVLAGESYVMFVDGDLKIVNDVTVADGGFLVFVVKGKVTVDPGVAKMQGLYVMDGSFVTQKNASGDDVPLEVQGSVVTWAGVSLNRDLGLGNNSGPAEKFVWRADLLTNMPRKLKTFLYNWQEVAPGTFGN